MTLIGQPERATQDRVVALFRNARRPSDDIRSNGKTAGTRAAGESTA
jgi:hypothetical protein